MFSSVLRVEYFPVRIATSMGVAPLSSTVILTESPLHTVSGNTTKEGVPELCRQRRDEEMAAAC